MLWTLGNSGVSVEVIKRNKRCVDHGVRTSILSIQWAEISGFYDALMVEISVVLVIFVLS